MKPYLHAKSSAKKFGGKPDEYQDIHDFLDSSKSAHASVKHRAVLHSAFGIFLAEKVFGHTRVNSDGHEYSVRDVAEQHVLEDLGTIPSLDDWLRHMSLADWMGGPRREKRTVRLETTELKALNENWLETGKKTVQKAMRAFMAEHQDVASLQWNQSAPSFNDGEPCYFSVGEPKVRLVDGDDEAGEEGDGYLCSWGLRCKAQKHEGDAGPLVADLELLGSLMSVATEAMKSLFGDGSKVTVGRNGEAEVEDYYEG